MTIVYHAKICCGNSSSATVVFVVGGRRSRLAQTDEFDVLVLIVAVVVIAVVPEWYKVMVFLVLLKIGIFFTHLIKGFLRRVWQVRRGMWRTKIGRKYEGVP